MASKSDKELMVSISASIEGLKKAMEQAEKIAAWKEQYLANKPANDDSATWAEWNAWGDWVVWVLENTPKDAYLLPQQIVEDVDTIE